MPKKVTVTSVAILVPSRPQDTLITLVRSLGIDLLWGEETGFHREPGDTTMRSTILALATNDNA